VLIGGRAAQGIGAALLSPSALSLVTTTFTGAERNKALGIWAAIGGAGSAIGVLVGGVLTSAAGWRWIFFINVPVGLLVLAALPALVAGGRSRTSRAMVDMPGALAVTAATGAAIYGLISAGSHGWLTARTVVPLGAAVVLYAIFAAIEHIVAAPLMDVRMLTRRPVAAGAFVMLVGTGLRWARSFSAPSTCSSTRGTAPCAPVCCSCRSRSPPSRAPKRQAKPSATSMAGCSPRLRWRSPRPAPR
jgi:MFS family permease